MKSLRFVVFGGLCGALLFSPASAQQENGVSQGELRERPRTPGRYQPANPEWYSKSQIRRVPHSDPLYRPQGQRQVKRPRLLPPKPSRQQLPVREEPIDRPSKVAASGQYYESPELAENRVFDKTGLDLRIFNGLRLDSFSSEYFNQSPTFLVNTDEGIQSELDFPNATETVIQERDTLLSYTMGGEVAYTPKSGFLRGLHMEGSGYYGVIFSGETDSSSRIDNTDLNAEEEELRFSTSADTEEDYLFGYEAAIGYGFDITESFFREHHKGFSLITPVIGYSVNEQHLTDSSNEIKTGELLSGTPTFAGSVDFESEWKAPFLGLRWLHEYRRHRVNFAANYYFLGDYEASQDSQMANDIIWLQSFDQEADVSGLRFELEYGYLLYDSIEFFGGFNFQRWTAEDGTQINTAPNGALNNVNIDEIEWDSYRLNLGVAYRW
jgi:hypothetical protein